MKLIVAVIFVFFANVAAAFLPASFRAHYTQEEKSIATGRIKKSEGQIEYRMPGHIRFEISKPNVVIFVANSKRSWFYSAPAFEGEAGEVTISSGSNHPILKFFDVVAKGDLKDNESYKVLRDGNGTKLEFTKKSQDDFGLTSALLTFDKEQNFLHLKSIAVSLTDGKTIRLQMKKLEPNVALPSQRFNFEIPANTRKNHQ